jgi:hypothetical protein
MFQEQKVKSQSQDEKIKEVGEKGTQNILDVISDKCKIIFPSTHVVYEGIDEVKKILKKMKNKTSFILFIIKSY